jgi:alkylation response protein AidB-like acyl-CoA dehydrogenase
MTASLTHGAAHLIESFATEDLKVKFVPKMYRGQWTGTMCLTESNAGSNLAAIETRAIREENCFKIKGNKIFISSGEHDMAENIIHLLLARIEGAPEGTKGISLFIVPKIRVNRDGSLGESNDVVCTAVEKKLGLHASPTCALAFGDNDSCIGYLCGEENKGLTYMFQMVNQGRINTAVSGMTLGSLAYQNALAYTKQRIQGADVSGRKDGYVPIIDHPDVRRMLLWMKATVDGMRSMIYTGAFWSDLALEMPEGDEKRHYQSLLDFITPIVKAYCSAMGFRVCETAIQCLGGYGYCKDYYVEQFLRDSKIASIYEGTNGIQSIDLMGRKMRINDGAPFKAFMKELGVFCQKNADHPTLGPVVRNLSGVSKMLGEAAQQIFAMRQSDALQWASKTYPILLCFGDITLIWRLLDMALVAQRTIDSGKKNDFYLGKVMQATYHSGVTLPITAARIETCLRTGREIVEMPQRAF